MRRLLPAFATLVLLTLLASPAAFGQDPSPPKDALDPFDDGSQGDKAQNTEDGSAQTAPPPPDRHVHMLFNSGGCFETHSTNLSHLIALYEHLSHNEGNILSEGSGVSALEHDKRVLIPETAITDGTLVSDALVGTHEREVLEERLPVLVSPWEINFQYPVDQFADWLAVMDAGGQTLYPDTQRVHARLVRLKTPRGPVLSLEFEDGPVPNEPVFWERQTSLLSSIITPEGKTHLYSIGRKMGHGIHKFEVIAQKRRPDSLIFSLGNVAHEAGHEGRDTACGEGLEPVGLTAMVPNTFELAKGQEKFLAWTKAHKLPFIAANLYDAQDKMPLRRFILHKAQGMTVAIIGVVGPEALDGLPAATARQWRIAPPRPSVSTVIDVIHKQLGRRPDLTIVLTGSRDSDKLAALSNNVDLVLGGRTYGDLIQRSQVVTTDPTTRRNARHLRALAQVRGTWLGPTEITASFTHDAALKQIHSLTHPLGPPPRTDTPARRAIREREEKEIAGLSATVIPDPADTIERHPELHDLVWGYTPHHFGRIDYPRSLPGRFTDPLWLRFLATLVRQDTGADIVVLRNTPRGSSIIGPLTRLYTNDWLRTAEPLQRHTIKGAALRKLLAYVKSHGPKDHDRETLLGAAGANLDTMKIAGRPLDNAESYTVVVAESVALDPQLAPLLGKGTPAGHVRDIANARFATWTDPATNGTLPAATAELESFLTQNEGTLQGRWLLRIDELSLSASFYTNSDDVADFAATRQTRLTTPDNTRLGAAANIALIYDGPSVAWETRTRGRLIRLLLDIPGQDIPPQEQADDLQIWTELRLNAIRVEAGASKFPIVPFIRSAIDTEFTAVPNPSADNPDKAFPHQLLLPQSAGFVAYPGRMIREVRLGALYQLDLAASEVNHDFGLTFGTNMNIPIWGPLAFTTEVDLRFLVPDNDDRPTDLALLMESNHRLNFQLTEAFSMFAFADLYLVHGKVPPADHFGGSWITGGGFQYRGVFKN